MTDELSEDEKAALAAAAQAETNGNQGDGDQDSDADTENSELDELRQALQDADTERARLQEENEQLTKKLAAANKKAGVKIARAGKKTFVLTTHVTGPDGLLEPGDEIELDAEQALFYRNRGLIEE